MSRTRSNFCYVPNARRTFNSVYNDMIYLPNSAVTESVTEKPVDPVNNVDPESRVGSEEKTVTVSSLKQMSNLEQFLIAIQPHVIARCLSERTMRGLRVWDLQPQPYFVLSDLWQSFREWSAYGAGVPLVLNDNDSIVQYYTPFLSGIQIYSEIAKPSVKTSINFNPQAHLFFEYLEENPPSMREPLVDKILDLASGLPELMTLRSCDILPSSWISVAWHPIYRIPTGPALEDLDACFLTYHPLHTPVGGPLSVQGPMPRHPTEIKGSVYKMCLPVFGLAASQFKGPLWTPNGGYEGQLASSLLQAADQWLRLLNVNHPDFVLFSHT